MKILVWVRWTLVIWMATIADIITESRRLLQDTVTPYRFDDGRLYWAFNVALKTVLQNRPDLFIDTSFVASEYDTSNSGDPFPLEDMYMLTVIDFIVGYTEMSDDEFTTDGRAATLLRTFRAQLTGA